MTSTQSANNQLLVSRIEARAAFGNALRLYVGRGRRYSVKQLSNATGVPDRTIESVMADPLSGEYRKPDLGEILSLTSFLGAEFTSEWLSRAGQAAFDLPEQDDTPPGALAADEAEDAAQLARCAADGDFTGDGPVLRPVALRMVARGMKLARVA